MKRLRSFEPIIDDNSRVLVLGSMPGERSLKEQQYYANPRNPFWKIINAMLGIPVSQEYNDKVSALQAKGIALWDVLKSCHRKGSLDSRIREEEVNDFTGLLQLYPNIKLIAFNGAKAYNSFKAGVGLDIPSVALNLMPSTSPANTMSLEHKIDEWSFIRNFVLEGDSLLDRI